MKITRRGFIKRFTIGVMASSMLMDALARGRPRISYIPEPEPVSKVGFYGEPPNLPDGADSMSSYIVEYSEFWIGFPRAAQGKITGISEAQINKVLDSCSIGPF